MNKNTTGMLMISAYLLLFFIFPFNGIVAILSLVIGSVLLFKIHYIFRGVVSFSPPGNPSTYTMKTFMTGVGIIFLVCATFMIFFITSAVGIAMDMNFVYSMVLVYVCGAFYIVLALLYNP